MNREELIRLVDGLVDQEEELKGTFKFHCYYYDPSLVMDEVVRRDNIAKYEQYKKNDFAEMYQRWYSKCLSVIKIVLPSRAEEFERLYTTKASRAELTVTNYTIFDALTRRSQKSNHAGPSKAFPLLVTQINIMKSVRDLLESRLNEIGGLLEFDIFEKEIDAARHLLQKGYLRSAGAICGVILEKHLSNMAKAAGITCKAKSPTINDLNSELYQNNVLDSAKYKFILYLADIRNKCDHSKDEEPSKKEVSDLIDGTKSVVATY